MRGQHYAESALLETSDSLRHEVEVRAQAELAAGMDDYLGKPISLDALRVALLPRRAQRTSA